MMGWTVAIYIVEKAYGGPEDGGWWYSRGTPADQYAHRTRGFAREADAHNHAIALNRSEFLKTLNATALEAGGEILERAYKAIVSDGRPRPFREKRPNFYKTA